MPPVTLARHAMATRFELVLHGDNTVALRAAGEEALDEVERLEARLSQFRPSSEIAHLNARAAHEPVQVTPTLFTLLQHAQKLYSETGGTFDITIEPLMRCWGFRDGAGREPAPDALADARAKVGMSLVRLNPADFTVEFARHGVRLDLGAIGKGYAIERAAQVLRDAGVTSALLHGGTSTVQGLGHPPDADCWMIAIGMPDRRTDSPPVPDPVPSAPSPPTGPIILSPSGNRQDAAPTLLATLPLRDEALSVSEISGRFFQLRGKTFGHILDPRTGHPVSGALLAAVALPSATETDALSTALLTLGTAGHERLASLRPGIRTLLVTDAGGQCRVEARGIAVQMPS